MKRRVLLTTAAAACLALEARAQSSSMPRIGWLGSGTAASAARSYEAFRQGLKDAGFLEGHDVTVDALWADGHYDRLPGLAESFVRRGVAVILAASLPCAIAAKAATSTIPIVFNMGADPVALKIVASLSRPGGNVTGISQLFGAVGGKRLQILRELVPRPGPIAILSNPQNPNAALHLDEIDKAARALGQKIEVFAVASVPEIEAAYAAIVQHGAIAVLVADDPFLAQESARLIVLETRHRLPTTYYGREVTDAGGLASDGSDNYRLSGGYVARILKGTRPADLPVLQPTKFELVINLKAAKALGLVVAPTLLASADEVIE